MNAGQPSRTAEAEQRKTSYCFSKTLPDPALDLNLLLKKILLYFHQDLELTYNRCRSWKWKSILLHLDLADL